MPKVRVIQATKGTLADKLPVAAYCRVSSNSEDQRHSFVAQVKEYTARIAENDRWELAGIYADKGITGTSALKRPEFLPPRAYPALRATRRNASNTSGS